MKGICKKKKRKKLNLQPGVFLKSVHCTYTLIVLTSLTSNIARNLFGNGITMMSGHTERTSVAVCFHTYFLLGLYED